MTSQEHLQEHFSLILFCKKRENNEESQRRYIWLVGVKYVLNLRTAVAEECEPEGTAGAGLLLLALSGQCQGPSE